MLLKIYIYIFANFIDPINSHKEVEISTFLIKVFIYGPRTTCILHNFQIFKNKNDSTLAHLKPHLLHSFIHCNGAHNNTNPSKFSLKSTPNEFFFFK
jgi:hypothetical protein